jgi:hypothetical protein
MRWQEVVACAVVGAVLIFGYELRVMKQEVEEMKAMREGAHRVAYEYPKGQKYEVSSRAGETFEQLVARAEKHVFEGSPLTEADFCWESDCERTVPPFGTYHIQICAGSQSQLDDDVARYCAMTTHTCVNCPVPGRKK